LVAQVSDISFRGRLQYQGVDVSYAKFSVRRQSWFMPTARGNN
jgi:hypothetical protein